MPLDVSSSRWIEPLRQATYTMQGDLVPITNPRKTEVQDESFHFRFRCHGDTGVAAITMTAKPEMKRFILNLRFPGIGYGDQITLHCIRSLPQRLYPTTGTNVERHANSNT